jgi:WD40 repeat protein
MTVTPGVASKTACPYPGLRPFRQDESLIFFGRDEQVDRLLGRLDRRRFLTLVGPSGCGKSSLVQAGLIPALRTGLMTSAGARWAVATMRPGRDPLRRLAEALLAEDCLGPRWSALSDPEAFLYSALRRGPRALADVLTETPPPGGRRLLLLVDQFEEVFRYPSGGDRAEAAAFVALILETARQESAPVYIAMTMRSDYLGQCARFAGLPEALDEGQFLTPRLTREQRREVIEEPARVFDGEVEPGLTARLLNDTGAGDDQLPLMQHVLMRLWKAASTSAGTDGRVTLTLADYAAIGGIDGALTRHADAVYLTLDPEGRRVAETLFRSLSERNAAGAEIRRPTAVQAVARVAGVDAGEVVRVVDAFRHPDLCFLTPELPAVVGPESWLDLSHETLLRQWDRLRGWVDDEAASAETYTRLALWAERWEAGRAGLWGAPDLDLALAWKDHVCPTDGWAERYGGDFPLAMRFLDASQARRKDDQADESRRAEERQEQRRMAEELNRLKEREEADRRIAEETDARHRAEAERAREQVSAARRQRRLIASAAAVLSVLALMLVFALLKAVHSANVAEVLRLSSQSKGLGQTMPRLSVLLAVEAFRRAQKLGLQLAEPEQALRDALAVAGGRVLRFNTTGVKALAFSLEGAPKRRLALAGDDRIIRVWDLDQVDARPILFSGAKSRTNALAFFPDGRRFAAGDDDHHSPVRVFELDHPDAKPRLLYGHKGSVRDLAISLTGDRVAVLGERGEVWVWDFQSKEFDSDPVKLTGGDRSLADIAFNKSGELVAAGFYGESGAPVDVWNPARSSPPVRRLVTAPVRAAVLAFDPKGEQLAVAGVDGRVGIWQVSGKKAQRSLALPGRFTGLTSLTFVGEGRIAVTVPDDNVARVWDLDRPDDIPKELRGIEGNIKALASAADGRTLACKGGDRTLRVWKISRPQAQPLEFQGKERNILAVAIGDNGRIAVSDDENEVREWDLSNPDKDPVIHHMGSVNALAYYDGRLVVGGNDGKVRDAGSNGRVLVEHDGPVYALAVGPNDRLAFAGGKFAAAGGRDWAVRVLDPSRPVSPSLVGHDDPVRALAFATDGSLAAGGSDGDVIVWDARGNALTPEPLNHSGRPIVALAFPANGRLAAADVDGVGWFWDLKTANHDVPDTALTEKVQGFITALAPIGDGRLAAAYAPGVTLIPAPVVQSKIPDFAAWLFRSGTGGAGESVDLPAAGACRLAVSPDGRLLAAGHAGGRVAVWTVPISGADGLKDEACKVVGRNLSQKEWASYFPSEHYRKTFPEISDEATEDD